MEGTDNTAPAAAENAPPAAPPAETAGAAALPPSETDWRTSLPPELRDALGDADPAEIAATYARGKGYVPAARAEDIALDLGEGVQLHPGLEKSFKEFCVSQGITPKQAQKIVEYNGVFSAEANRLYLEQGNAQLERRFGVDTGRVKDNALKAFMSLDRRMDGRLSASPGGRQIASDPLVVEAFSLIQQVLSEDALGGGAAAGGEERALDDRAFFEQVLKQQQGGS